MIKIKPKPFVSVPLMPFARPCNAMCSHKINLTGLEDIDGEVMDWLKKAYQTAEL